MSKYRLQEIVDSFINDIYNKYGIVVREITFNSVSPIINDIRENCIGEDVCVLPILGEKYTGDIVFKATLNDNQKYCCMFKNINWIVNYMHSSEMNFDYLSSWRPALSEISKMDNPIGVEVGVFEGFLSELILKFIHPKKLYLVDPHKVYSDDIGNLGKLNQLQWDNLHNIIKNRYRNVRQVEVIRKTSLDSINDFKDKSLDFVYLDSDHSTQAVFEDIKNWYKKIRVGGILSGHDATEETVSNGVDLAKTYLESIGKSIDVIKKSNDWWMFK